MSPDVISESRETAPDGDLDHSLRGRLAQLLGLFDTRKSAADIAEKSVDQLQAYLKGRSALPLLPIARLCAAKGVSLDWLALGRPDTGPGPAGFTEPAAPGFTADESLVHIPSYDWDRSGAGPRMDAAQVPGGLALPAAFVAGVLGCAPESLAAMVARGEAMAPTVSDGSLVVVDIADRRLSDGCLYVLDAGEAALIRRITRQASGGLRLVADHSGYADEFIAPGEADALTVIGRAVWLGCVC